MKIRIVEGHRQCARAYQTGAHGSWPMRRLAPPECFGAALLGAAFACGGGSPDDAEGSGAGGSSALSDGGIASGGTSSDRPPASAPACTTESVPFQWIDVRGLPAPGESRRVRFVERGFGLPPSFAELPGGVSSPDDVGWLWVAAIEGRADALGDAGAPDAGPSLDPSWIIAGPRELGELAVSSDEVLELSEERSDRVFYQHHRVVLRAEEGVLLFHQSTTQDRFGSFSGFTLEGGDAICARPFPSVGTRCADVYRQQLELTVPGGAAATIMPGERQTVGEYVVLAGTITTVQRFPPRDAGETGCADVGEGDVQLTAVLQRSEP